jgi:hypothetical protein
LILKEIECEDLDWIQLDQDKDQWQALMNTNIHIRVL